MKIENEEDYWIAMRRIDELISFDPKDGTDLFDELNVISTQIESYENVHYKIETSDFP